MITDEQCWPTYTEGCGQDCVAFHPYRELDEFMVCHNDTRARTQQDENVVTWFDDDTEMQTSGPHTGASSPFIKNVRDDGRDIIRPGLNNGNNPLWSKNGDTPTSTTTETSDEAKAVAAEAEAKQTAGSEEAAAKAAAATDAEAATRTAAGKAAAKTQAEAREASRKATKDEVVKRRELNRATKKAMRDAEVGAMEAEKAAKEARQAAKAEPEPSTDPKYR